MKQRTWQSRVRRGSITVIAAALFGGSPLFADELYQWKDAFGNLHLSNIPQAGVEGTKLPDGSSSEADPSASFMAEADSAINALNAEIRRYERMLAREEDDLNSVREELYRVDKTKEGSGAVLRSQEELQKQERLSDQASEHQQEIGKLKVEIKELEKQLAHLKTVKVSGGSELEALAPREP